MALVINSNLSSIRAQNNMTSADNIKSQAQDRLSSGKRINAAADDAAGLSISTKMTAQVRGTSQAMRNANDGVSMLQVADGSLNTSENILLRMKEISVQSATGHYQEGNRELIDAEFTQLKTELDRISQESEYNGLKLFGTGEQFSLQVSAEAGESIGFTIPAIDSNTLGVGGSQKYVLSDKALADPVVANIMNGLNDSWISESEALIEKYYGLTGNGATLKLNMTDIDGPFNAIASVGLDPGKYKFASQIKGGSDSMILNIDLADFDPNNPTVPEGDRIIAHEMVHAVMQANMNFYYDDGIVPGAYNGLPGWFTEGTAELIQGADERVSNLTTAGANLAALDNDAFLKEDRGSPSGAAVDEGYAVSYLAAKMLQDDIFNASNGAEGMDAVMTELASADTMTLDRALNRVATRLDLTWNGVTGSAVTLADFEAHYKANDLAYMNGTYTTTVGGTAQAHMTGHFNLADQDTGTIAGSDYFRGTKTSENILPNDPDSGPAKDFDLIVPDEYIVKGATQGVGDPLAEHDLLTADNASEAIKAVDFALESISEARAGIGAMKNRLDFTVAVLSETLTNTVAARSRIEDTDYASESATLSRGQVLQQASQTMLAQANSSPQQVLSLLQ